MHDFLAILSFSIFIWKCFWQEVNSPSHNSHWSIILLFSKKFGFFLQDKQGVMPIIQSKSFTGNQVFSVIIQSKSFTPNQVFSVTHFHGYERKWHLSGISGCSRVSLPLHMDINDPSKQSQFILICIYLLNTTFMVAQSVSGDSQEALNKIFLHWQPKFEISSFLLLIALGLFFPTWRGGGVGSSLSPTVANLILVFWWNPHVNG